MYLAHVSHARISRTYLTHVSHARISRTHLAYIPPTLPKRSTNETFVTHNKVKTTRTKLCHLTLSVSSLYHILYTISRDLAHEKNRLLWKAREVRVRRPDNFCSLRYIQRNHERRRGGGRRKRWHRMKRRYWWWCVQTRFSCTFLRASSVMDMFRRESIITTMKPPSRLFTGQKLKRLYNFQLCSVIHNRYWQCLCFMAIIILLIWRDPFRCRGP